MATATPSPAPAIFGLPSAPTLTAAGEALIREQEGFDYRPEWPSGASGTTWGYGYDAHQNTVANILNDWSKLPPPAPRRLADTHPYSGRAAIAPTRAVHDIYIPHDIGADVFDRIDVSREFENARRALPGFDDLRPNAQAALISLGFNRGWSMVGNNRIEMRAIRDLVPKKDYAGMADQFMKMRRVWKGTSIEHDMYMRRAAEANLMRTP